MVDFVKIVIPPFHWESLIKNNYLEFIVEVNEKTGETSNKLIAEYHNLKFIMYDKTPDRKGRYIELQGSLHKYHNEGKHNADNFTLDNIHSTIHNINRRFNLSIETYKLSNTEIGVNIEPCTLTSTVLNGILFHNMEKVKDVFIKDGNYKQAAHSQYYVKYYDKGKQYRGKHNLPKNENLRFELKFIKMQPLNHKGIYTLEDLLSTNSLNKLLELLIKAWDDTFIFDKTIAKNQLSKHQRNTKYYQWKDADYWLELAPQRRYEQRNKYNQVVELYSDKTQNSIRELIKNKWELLTNNSLSNYRIINTHFVMNLQFDYSVNQYGYQLGLNEFENNKNLQKNGIA